MKFNNKLLDQILKEDIAENINAYKEVINSFMQENYLTCVCAVENTESTFEWHINIYELISKCKEYLLTEHYSLNIHLRCDGKTDIYVYENHEKVCMTTCQFQTEEEAIIKICEWTLERQLKDEG